MTVPMPKVDAGAFAVYVDWLFDLPHVRVPREQGRMLRALIRAYQLGVDFQEPEFCKDVLKFILRDCVDANVHPGWRDISIAYEITSSDPSSPLRKFLVRIYMQLENLEKVLDEKWERYPDGFQRDLMRELARERGRQVKHWSWELRERSVLTDL